MALADEKYLALTTFRKSGDAVTTPVWTVGLDNGDLGFWTSSASGKVKRLKHTDRVVVQPSDARGRVTEGTEPVSATATLSMTPEPEIVDKVKVKYGLMTKVTKLLAKLAHPIKTLPYADVTVRIHGTSGSSPGRA